MVLRFGVARVDDVSELVGPPIRPLTGIDAKLLVRQRFEQRQGALVRLVDLGVCLLQLANVVFDLTAGLSPPLAESGGVASVTKMAPW